MPRMPDCLIGKGHGGFERRVIDSWPLEPRHRRQWGGVRLVVGSFDKERGSTAAPAWLRSLGWAEPRRGGVPSR